MPRLEQRPAENRPHSSREKATEQRSRKEGASRRHKKPNGMHESRRAKRGDSNVNADGLGRGRLERRWDLPKGEDPISVLNPSSAVGEAARRAAPSKAVVETTALHDGGSHRPQRFTRSCPSAQSFFRFSISNPITPTQRPPRSAGPKKLAAAATPGRDERTWSVKAGRAGSRQTRQGCWSHQGGGRARRRNGC